MIVDCGVAEVGGVIDSEVAVTDMVGCEAGVCESIVEDAVVWEELAGDVATGLSVKTLVAWVSVVEDVEA